MSETDIGAGDRTIIGEDALAEKIMRMLRERPAGVDARSVMLEHVREDGAACNWRIGHFDPGRGNRYACKLALRRIHETLRDSYQLAG